MRCHHDSAAYGDHANLVALYILLYSLFYSQLTSRASSARTPTSVRRISRILSLPVRMSINHNAHHNTLPLNLMIFMYGYVAMVMTARCLPFDADLSADVEVPIRRQ